MVLCIIAVSLSEGLYAVISGMIDLSRHIRLRWMMASLVQEGYVA